MKHTQKDSHARFFHIPLGNNDVSHSLLSQKRWAKSGAENALERTEAIFDRMVAMYESGHALAEPNLFSYVILINAYGRYSGPSSAQKAEDALFEMYRKYQAGTTVLKPNIQLVTTVIDCWRKSRRRDAGERAEALLDWVLNLYREGHDRSIQPNEFTFASTIGAWGRSRKMGKAVRARNILTKLIKLHESGDLDTCPNAHCYTAVINCCCYCENDAIEKREALRIAITTYKELLAKSEEYGGPNEISYSAMLTALRNLLPQGKDRSSAVQTVFKNAADDGRVDSLVVRRAQSCLTAEESRDLFPKDAISKDGQIRVDQLPIEWRKNCLAQSRN